MTVSLIDALARQERRLARARVAAAVEADRFGVLTRRDLLPRTLRSALQRCWDDDALLARRRDGVDQHWFEVGHRDGTVAEGAAELLRRWAGELRLTDDDLIVSDNEWPAITGEIIRLDAADRAAAEAVLGSTRSVPRAAAGRYLSFMALRVDADDRLYGHPADGPVTITVADPADDLNRPRARTPRWMPQLSAPKPPAPVERLITAEVLHEIAVDRTLLQYGEKIDNWDEVLTELRRLVAKHKR